MILYLSPPVLVWVAIFLMLRICTTASSGDTASLGSVVRTVACRCRRRGNQKGRHSRLPTARSTATWYALTHAVNDACLELCVCHRSFCGGP